jgi:signal transduction histidine kinase/ligand-binding sensor domain-containing protein/ActR/RegA family two-component response regulator
VLFPSLLHVSAEADLPEMRFDHAFDLESQSGPAFMQDDDGFLWIGTKDNGMFRYDGYELKHYGVGPGLLPNGRVYDIVADRENPDIFWLATGGGMQRFDKTTEAFTYYLRDPEDPRSLGHNTVNDIVQDSTNSDILWLGTENGLNRFDKTTETFVRYEPDPDDPDSVNHPGAWRIIEDGADPNIIWVGTFGGGLDRFDKTTEIFTHHVHDPDDPDSFGGEDNVVSAVIQDKDDPNILWVSALESGLDRFDKRTGTFTHYVHDPDDPESIRAGLVAMIYDDGYGRLWLGGWVDNNGLAIFDKATETFTHYKHNPADPYSLSNDFVVNVYEDRSGIFWVSTLSGTVDKVDRYTQKFTLYQSSPYGGGLSGDVVTALLEDRSGAIWFGTQGGLNRLDRETGVFTHYLHDPDDPDSLDYDNIACLYEDSSGAFWVCLFPGPLVQFDQDTGKVLNRYAPPGVESFTDIVEDPNDPDVLWLGTRLKGLARFDKHTETFVFYPTNRQFPQRGALSNFIYIVEHDREEAALWIGGWESGGLSRFDIATETFTHYRHQPDDPASLAADAIADIYQDASGSLWIGTKGGGLDQLDKETGQFTHYAQDVGIPSEVNAILEEDSGYLWLSTNEGILRFDPQTAQVEVRYTQSDGLQGDVFFRASSLRSRDGTLWFGGINGANSFRPDALITNPHEPPVVLTALTQGGEPIDGGGGRVPNEVEAITLDWQQNFFEFEFAALNFTVPTSNRYRYILEGLDKDWYDAGAQRFGRYAGLPPGSYTLRIKGSNNDGVWNETGVSLKVTVTAPFWQTREFYALVAAIAASVFLLVYRQKSRQLRRERAVAAERARLTKQIQKHADQVHQIINTIPEGVFLLDPDHTVALANPAARKYLKVLADAGEGDKLDRLGNRPLTELMTSPPRGLWHEIEIDGDRPKSFEVITRSTETGPDLDGWVVVVRDVTREREIQLHAQQQNRLAAVGQLAAGIAHDFNNIMAVIILYVQILEKTAGLSDKAKGRLSTIMDQARRAAALIDQILDFSRRSVMEARPLNLEPFVKEQVKLLQRVVPENIRIHMDGDDEATINADPTRIQQVIMNLVLNARDAMPDGGEVRIALKRMWVREKDTPLPGMKAGEWVQLTVADTGAGIAPEILPNIFEPFFTTKGPGEGTGLGLAQVYGIVRRHDGYIDVDTRPGEGTTFTLYFPLLLAKPVEAPAREVEISTRGNGETILVVEDNPDARQALVESLALLNYRTLQASNGKDALATWVQHRDEIDLILSDAVMPEMGGIALFHALKQETPEVKVVLLTGHLLDTQPENQFEALMRQGLTGWLRKPVDLEALAAMLAESFSK